MALVKCKECGSEISNAADSCPHCGRKKPRPLISFVKLIVVLFFGMFIYNLFSHSDPGGVVSGNKKNTAIGQMNLNYRWESVGSVMVADFTIKNNSDQDVKDIEITCTHLSNSGTKIDTNKRTIYEVFNKHNEKTIKKFNMGFIHNQATKSSCDITNLSFL